MSTIAVVAAEEGINGNVTGLVLAVVFLALNGFFVAAEFAPVLRSLRGANAEATAIVEGILDGCAAALSEAGVLKELGNDIDSSSDAYDQIEALAKSAVEAGRAKSQPEAIGLVASENPDLYARYRQEMGV